MFKLAIKYGLLITVVLVVWVVVVRFLLNVPAGSNVHMFGPILFNVAAIIAIFLGIRARKNEVGGNLGFKEALKTGMAISLVYAITGCLFFAIEFLIAGPALLMSEAGPSPGPLWQVAAMAYAGLFLGSLFFGLIYSTLISFFLARRRGRNYTEII